MNYSAIFSLLMVLTFCAFTRAELSPALMHLTKRDTTCKVWVIFKDKPRGGTPSVAPRALARRLKSCFNFSEQDLPINSEYLKKISQTGAVLKNAYKWDNAASFLINSAKLSAVSEMPFVKSIQLVHNFSSVISFKGLNKRRVVDGLNYGNTFDQMKFISVTDAHDYLSRLKKLPAPGSGIRIAFFDSGFRLKHPCFSYALQHNSIKATRDFIDDDSTVFDPDSVASDTTSPYYTNDEHGTCVLSLVAGYDPGKFVGVAYGAEFILARTENTYWNGYEETEIHSEEDNWAAAVVWAESLGVDIISSSLGYRDDFQDSVEINRNGKPEIVTNYTYSDLDGNTTIVSRAAKYAAERGMLVICAVGNDGSRGIGSLCAPADVEGVIAVGAVTNSGQSTFFSSMGPTADGRIKPDLVAQGTDITIPVIYGSPNGTYVDNGNGTSFSTPFVTGICALLLQSHGRISSDEARNYLLNSCMFVKDQNSINNSFGHGLPDALMACLRDNEVYLSVTDLSNKPIRNALITDKIGDSLSVSDSLGTALFTLDKKVLPCSLWVKLSGQDTGLLINALPTKKNVKLNLHSGTIISLRDTQNRIISGGSISIKYDNSGEFIRNISDSSGNITITNYREMPLDLYAYAQGYKQSDTIGGKICTEICTLVVKLEKLKSPEFVLFPTVLHLQNGFNDAFHIRFQAGSGDLGLGNMVTAEIHSIDGRLIWKHSEFAEPYSTVTIDCRPNKNNGTIAPGMYFFVVKYGKKTFRKKILIVE